MQHAHSQSNDKHNLHRWELGLVATAAAIIATPYVLPLIGVGDTVLAANVSGLCSSTKGGLTQAIEGVLGKTPYIGGMLSAAGWGAALTSGAIGVAGVLIGDYIHKHYDRKGHIQWGTVIKYAALTTSVFIALPSILSGISMGVAYLAGLAGSDALFAARDVMASTIGFSGVAHDAPTGLAGLVPHLFTCGRALLPAGLAIFASQKSKPHSAEYDVTMVSPAAPSRGVPTELAFQIVDKKSGRKIDESELKVLHTRPLHTMVVDSSLRDYHHLHPKYDPVRKAFVCQFTPALRGNYAMWNDFTVKGEEQPFYLKTNIGGLHGFSLPTRVEHTSRAEADGLTVRLTSDQRLSANSDAMLTVDVRDKAGNPVTNLEPIMGAYAHLVGFSADGKHFIHSHPMGPEPHSNSARGASPLCFHVSLPDCSGVKFFLQIQREGKLLTLPFGQAVAQSKAIQQQQAAGTALVSSIATGMGR